MDAVTAATAIAQSAGATTPAQQLADFFQATGARFDELLAQPGFPLAAVQERALLQYAEPPMLTLVRNPNSSPAFVERAVEWALRHQSTAVLEAIARRPESLPPQRLASLFAQATSPTLLRDLARLEAFPTQQQLRQAVAADDPVRIDALVNAGRLTRNQLALVDEWRATRTAAPPTVDADAPMHPALPTAPGGRPSAQAALLAPGLRAALPSAITTEPLPIPAPAGSMAPAGAASAGSTAAPNPGASPAISNPAVAQTAIPAAASSLRGTAPPVAAVPLSLTGSAQTVAPATAEAAQTPSATLGVSQSIPGAPPTSAPLPTPGVSPASGAPAVPASKAPTVSAPHPPETIPTAQALSSSIAPAPVQPLAPDAPTQSPASAPAAALARASAAPASTPVPSAPASLVAPPPSAPASAPIFPASQAPSEIPPSISAADASAGAEGIAVTPSPASRTELPGMPADRPALLETDTPGVDPRLRPGAPATSALEALAPDRRSPSPLTPSLRAPMAGMLIEPTRASGALPPAQSIFAAPSVNLLASAHPQEAQIQAFLTSDSSSTGLRQMQLLLADRQFPVTDTAWRALALGQEAQLLRLVSDQRIAHGVLHQAAVWATIENRPALLEAIVSTPRPLDASTLALIVQANVRDPRVLVALAGRRGLDYRTRRWLLEDRSAELLEAFAAALTDPDLLREVVERELAEGRTRIVETFLREGAWPGDGLLEQMAVETTIALAEHDGAYIGFIARAPDRAIDALLARGARVPAMLAYSVLSRPQLTEHQLRRLRRWPDAAVQRAVVQHEAHLLGT